MAHPSSYSSSPLSSPSSSSSPPSTSKTTNENDGASSAMISGGFQRTSSGTMVKTKTSKRNLTPSIVLVVTTVISTLLVILATGSSCRFGVLSPASIKARSNNDKHTPPLLRRGNSEADSAITASGLVPSPPFLTSGLARRSVQQTLVDDNNDNSNNKNNGNGNGNGNGNITDVDTIIICDLEYCQTTFEENLCLLKDEEENSLSSIPIWLQALILLVLLIFSALFSGLTLGLMSLDITGLEIVMAGDDPRAAKYAEIILPVRKQGNLLLCTLLLGNVAVNSLMSIFSAAIFDGTIGFLASTFAIVIFGEIIPQALCSRYALRIGSIFVPTVKVIRFVLFIISYPLAKALDLALGRELATTYSNAEMIELLNVHVKANIIDQEEANAMAGALTYKNIPVKDAMTAMEQTFMLGVDEKLSFETIGTIFKTGYSRIPVFEISRNNIIGLLFVKDLIFLDPEDCVPVRSFIQIFGRNAHLVWPDDTLGDVLTDLKKGKSHLAVVRDVNNKDKTQDPFYEVKGIITLEDIVERIIGDSIVDETDAFVDNNQSIKVERGDTFEWARLRLLDTKIVDEMLSPSEIRAVTAHLKTNHGESFKLLTDSALSLLVSSTPVTTLQTATQDLDKQLPNELLYEKNVPSDTFTLILSGKVTIFVGSENFRSDISSWAVLGARALEDKEWAPDYSAFVSDGPCRCLQIHRAPFIEAADASLFERRISENNAIRNYPRTGISQWTKEVLSVASSSVDGLEDTSSIASSMDGKVANRRKTVLARIYDSKGNLGFGVDDDDEVVRKPSETLSNGLSTNAVQFVADDSNINSKTSALEEK